RIALETKPAGDVSTFGGPERRFQAGTPFRVLNQGDAFEASAWLSRRGQQAQAQPAPHAVGFHGMKVHGRTLLAHHGGNPPIAQDSVLLEGCGELAWGELDPGLLTRPGRSCLRRGG